MSTLLPIQRTRGDTRRMVFVIKDSTGVIVDISAWTSFLLTVDPEIDPASAANNLFQAAGALVTDGTDGRVSFTPTGSSNAGEYHYDAQALDSNSEKITFASGAYNLIQDITKD